MAQMTLNDLTKRVLQDLNLFDAEQTPPASDFTYTQNVITQEFAYLTAKGVIFEGTTINSIAPQYVNLLSDYMGASIGPTYGAMSFSDAEQIKKFTMEKINDLSVPTKVPELLTIERAARGQRIRDPIVSQG